MDALLIVDLQNDFMPGGPLGVPGADEVIPVANALADWAPLVVATQDWHPPDHLSFAANHPGKKVGDVVTVAGLEQILWPVHCVQGTPGAELVSGLNRDAIHHVVRKGMDPEVDSYSAFYDNDRRHDTGLASWLRERGVDRLFVCGVATDYCVKYSVLDALREGFDTWLVQDGCRGVDLHPGDVEAALEEMAQAGAHLVTSELVLQMRPRTDTSGES